MSTRYHAIPQQLFDALAAGRGGTEAIAVLAAAQHSKHVLLLRGVLEAARDASADQARCARLGGELLAEVERHDQPVAARIMRYPAVGAWAVRTLLNWRGDDRTPRAVPAQLATVAAAAAIQSGLDAEVPVLPVNGVVSLPSLGAARVEAESAVVRSRAGRAEVRWAHGRVDIPADARHDAPGWRGLRSCQAGEFTTVIEDLDPFRMPAVDDLAPRLAAGEAQHWVVTDNPPGLQRATGEPPLVLWRHEDGCRIMDASHPLANLYQGRVRVRPGGPGDTVADHLAGQVTEHLTPLLIEAECPGNAVNADILQVPQEGVHRRGPG